MLLSLSGAADGHISFLPLSSPGLMSPLAAQAHFHDDVCITPHAPAEGGKRNALLMRVLNKKKSLKRLEETMLLVAAQGDSAAGETAGLSAS